MSTRPLLADGHDDPFIVWPERGRRSSRRAGIDLAALLPAGVDDRALVERLQHAGIISVPLSESALTPLARGGLLLGFAAYSPSKLRAAASVLGRTLRGDSAEWRVARSRTTLRVRTNMAGVAFWWLPEEEERFLEWLTAEGVFATLSGCAAEVRAFAAVPVRELLATGEHGKIMIGPERFARAPSLQFYEQTGADGVPAYCISERRSCLVAWRRGRRRGNEIGASNLSVDWSTSKPAQSAAEVREFRTWAERLLRWVRQATPERHEHRIQRLSRPVKQGLADGSLTVHPHPL